MMKNNEVHSITKDLFYLLDSFKETALTKQRALIENNMQSLDKCISEEERLLFEVQSLFKRRTNMMDKLQKQKKLNDATPNLTPHEKDHSHVEDLFRILKNEREMIAQKVKAINLINEQNKYLTEQARGFIRSLVGELAEKHNKKILDVKA